MDSEFKKELEEYLTMKNKEHNIGGSYVNLAVIKQAIEDLSRKRRKTDKEKLYYKALLEMVRK